jgi:hypothetical protein
LYPCEATTKQGHKAAKKQQTCRHRGKGCLNMRSRWRVMHGTKSARPASARARFFGLSGTGKKPVLLIHNMRMLTKVTSTILPPRCAFNCDFCVLRANCGINWKRYSSYFIRLSHSAETRRDSMGHYIQRLGIDSISFSNPDSFHDFRHGEWQSNKKILVDSYK